VPVYKSFFLPFGKSFFGRFAKSRKNRLLNRAAFHYYLGHERTKQKHEITRNKKTIPRFFSTTRTFNCAVSANCA
jgi:hypothetical protein